MKKLTIILFSIFVFTIQAHGTEPGTTINGEWDTHGKHYTPAGNGNKWRQDGTFMQKAAGGYIDTRTGEFAPAN